MPRARVLAFLRASALTFDRGFVHATTPWCARHGHPAFEIVYHTVGGGVTTDDRGVTTTFEEGGVVVYPPHVAHDQAVPAPGEDVCVHVGCAVPPPPELSATMYVPRLSDPRVGEELVALCRTAPHPTPLEKLARDHRAAAAFLRLVEDAGVLTDDRRHAPAERYAEAAYDFVRENYARIGSIEEVARAAGIGYDHLRHAFRRRYGMSIKRWHLEVRIERAKDLLAHTALVQKVIAGLCGFGTERYFSSSFRKSTGTTPGEYRQAHAT